MTCSQTQKIAADKVNIMECDSKSTSVTIKFFFQNLAQYIVHCYALTVELLEKSVVWKPFY